MPERAFSSFKAQFFRLLIFYDFRKYGHIPTSELYRNIFDDNRLSKYNSTTTAKFNFLNVFSNCIPSNWNVEQKPNERNANHQHGWEGFLSLPSTLNLKVREDKQNENQQKNTQLFIQIFLL